MVKELHTMIVWSKAMDSKTIIEEKICENFKLHSVIDIQWDKSSFCENLKVFYAHSQKHLDSFQLDDLLKNKVEHCGDGPFTLFVYEDPTPTYDFRITSSGNRKVNIKVFDLKKSLRKSIGGGHKIHASDNLFESNKDLTLLLGINIHDFLKKHPSGIRNTQLYQKNCIGVNGYKNIKELFYVLNNSINYCVIRNYECLPESYTVEGHGDIDLLVEDFNYIRHLTLATSYFPGKAYRVHYGIKIANSIVPFDFRYVGDQYYDIKWQYDILKETTFFNSIVRIPNLQNYFYTLLYHAYIQKKAVKEDYYLRLESMAQELQVDYRSDYSLQKIKTILNAYMNLNKYSYTVPLDKTVYFNQLFLKHERNRISKFGKLISSRQSRLEDEILFTEVYDDGEVITKYGSCLIIDTELFFLDLLKGSGLVPKIHNYVLEKNNCYVVLEKLKGETLDLAVHDARLWSKKNIKSLIKQLIYFNELLLKYNIMHRDIRPGNIMVSFDQMHNVQLKLIDFGWATKLSKIETVNNPIGLGAKFKYREGQFSDVFSTGKMLAYIFRKFDFKDKLFSELNEKPSAYIQPEVLKYKLEIIKNDKINKLIKFNFKDSLMLLIYQNPIVLNNILAVKKYFNKNS